MPKPPIRAELYASDIIETLLAGHHLWRSDLSYPESHSDMTGAVYGLLLKYDVTLRPIPRQPDDVWEPGCPHKYIEESSRSSHPICVVCRQVLPLDAAGTRYVRKDDLDAVTAVLEGRVAYVHRVPDEPPGDAMRNPG